MVAMVFLHMCRVFFTGSYKKPREFNWVIGVILLTLTLLLSFTGYLLPWDQLALWAVAVGTEQPGEDPNDHVVFVIDDDVCTRCALCVDRCPTGVIILGKVGDPVAGGDPHQRTNTYGYGYGMRLG